MHRVLPVGNLITACLHVGCSASTCVLTCVSVWAAAPCSCIRDDFYGARDTLLMSRIQEQTGQLDAKMQVGSKRHRCGRQASRLT